MKKTCTATQIFYLLSKQWSLQILYILNKQSFSFTCLQNKLKGISRKVLSERLKQMMAYKIVEKIKIGNSMKTQQYQITVSGKKLSKEVERFEKWAMR